MRFPYHLVPDGHVGAPHHVYIGLIVALLALAVMWDNRDEDPWLAAGALGGILFSFVTVWPFYPVVGASLTLLALLVSAVAPVLRRDYWREVTKGQLSVYLLGVLVAADDVLEHSFGVSTPLDTLWKVALHPLVRAIETLA